MHPRIEEVLEYLDTTRAALGDAVEQVAPARRDERPALDRWSVAEVLDHLTIIERRIARLVSGSIVAAQAAGLGPETETSAVLDTLSRERILDRTKPAEAPEPVRPQSGADAASGWQALQQTRTDLRAATLAGDGLALSEVKHEHPVLGLINLYQWLIFVGAHEARHTDQISEIARAFSDRSSATAGADVQQAASLLER